MPILCSSRVSCGSSATWTTRLGLRPLTSQSRSPTAWNLQLQSSRPTSNSGHHPFTFFEDNDDVDPARTRAILNAAFICRGFGVGRCISPRLFWSKLQECYSAEGGAKTKPPVSLTGQLIWREYFTVIHLFSFRANESHRTQINFQISALMC